jgi:hypothetical protein
LLKRDGKLFSKASPPGSLADRAIAKDANIILDEISWEDAVERFPDLIADLFCSDPPGRPFRLRGSELRRPGWARETLAAIPPETRAEMLWDSW